MSERVLASIDEKVRACAVIPRTSTVELLLHINETLGTDHRNDIVTALEESPGVHEARFCENRVHLMLVAYDPDVTTSGSILDRVRHQSVHAQLVGPV